MPSRSSLPASAAGAPRLLDRVVERARYLHYSLRTEKAYVYWIRFFIRWHGMRHPREMGAAEVQAFLGMLATQRRVSSATHNQALSALLFLYREVLAAHCRGSPICSGRRGPSAFRPCSRASRSRPFSRTCPARSASWRG